MKITLTIELELPDECEAQSDEELRQNLFDDVINYATCSHLEDALHWCAEAAKTSNSTAQRISDHHGLWADICGNVKWSVKRGNHA